MAVIFNIYIHYFFHASLTNKTDRKAKHMLGKSTHHFHENNHMYLCAHVTIQECVIRIITNRAMV